MDKDSDREWLDGKFDRTSVTVDEAVLILLGWADGPVILHPRSDNPTKCISEEDPRTTSLDYLLARMGETSVLECKEAIERQLPDHVIAEKRATMKKVFDVVSQAKAYLCAIKDELNEGDLSALRIDKELSTGAVRFITRSSFVRWVQDRFGISFASPIPQPKANPAPQELPPVGVKEASQGSNQKSPPRQKMRAQERAILDAIAGLELDPKCLQRNIGRQPGAKSQILTKLKGHALFSSQKVFDKAWERMLGSDIAYAEEEVSSP